jgi:hypothetical protein
MWEHFRDEQHDASQLLSSEWNERVVFHSLDYIIYKYVVSSN